MMVFYEMRPIKKEDADRIRSLEDQVRFLVKKEEYYKVEIQNIKKNYQIFHKEE